MANHNQWAAFANDVKTGGMPKANQMTGLISAICGHKGNEAIRNGSTVEIDPALMAFDCDTPDPHLFDPVEGPDLQETMAEVQKKKLEDAKKVIKEAEEAAKA